MFPFPSPIDTSEMPLPYFIIAHTDLHSSIRGSDAGRSFTYMLMNRLIKKYDLYAIFISGPRHGAPAVLSRY